MFFDYFSSSFGIRIFYYSVVSAKLLIQSLWSSGGDVTALHSVQHQIIKAVPLVVLSSSFDVDEVIVHKETRNIGYFFDTCDGGNGAVEAIFTDFPKFAATTYALASECGCDMGCPRCLHSTACPQENEPLLKDVGLFLLEVISQAALNSQNSSSIFGG